MASETFKKRQKERARQEKRQRKAARLNERRKDKGKATGKLDNEGAERDPSVPGLAAPALTNVAIPNISVVQ
jgi:hypothetical protein